MKPSAALRTHRESVRRTALRFPVANPRVFGSVVRGVDRDGSDLDLLVDPLPGATLFDLGALQIELEELLGVRVDLLTPNDLPPPSGARARRSYADVTLSRLPEYIDQMLAAARLARGYADLLARFSVCHGRACAGCATASHTAISISITTSSGHDAG